MDANQKHVGLEFGAAVSIHAPVMDANWSTAPSTDFAGFNPRARDGREQLLSPVDTGRFSFNPRARDGREIYDKYFDEADDVSIHAPVMDAKSLSALFQTTFMFQSTRP